MSKTAPPATVLDPLTRAAKRAKLSLAGLMAVKAWLAEQFLANVYAKLGQGGYVEGEIALRRVFVDLPVGNTPGESASSAGRCNFLKDFLQFKLVETTTILRLAMTMAFGETSDYRLRDDKGRLLFCQGALLIGGPGQGKSTLSQLACQLQRATLLTPFAAALSLRHRELLDSFNNPAASQTGAPAELVPPAKPYFPLQISLPDLAAWLVTTTPEQCLPAIPLLIQYLATRPSAVSCGLLAVDLYALIAKIPVLLVLDGFDEVGANNDRMQVVQAVRDLLVVLLPKNKYMQLLATTRPHGYAGELAQIGVVLDERYLLPLTAEEALHYAGKLIAEKIPGKDQQQEMQNRLAEAVKEPATQRLLTSPLQITILAALVQQGGRAPRERWELFHKYFTFTYNREIERNTYASSLLADHRRKIEQIHARVALLLQVDAERSGGAAARMSRERLEEVIHAVLDEDEIAQDERIGLVRDIIKAAEQRLVFLVEPEPNSFGFEIRSLQEFMAAWALTSGREIELEARLQIIARTPMFRNVTLFIASRLFSEGTPLRDFFAESLCSSMNHDANDELASITCAGSLLALEILEEGAVLAQPKRARALMAQACGLLTLPSPINPRRLVLSSPIHHARLARVSNADTAPILVGALEPILQGLLDEGEAVAQELYGAWQCLFEAMNHGAGWAVVLGERFWPKLQAPEKLLQFCNVSGDFVGKWLVEKLARSNRYISPRNVQFLPDWAIGWMVWLPDLAALSEEYFYGHRVHGAAEIPGDLGATVLPGALPWRAVGAFIFEPGAKTLVDALEQIADFIPQEDWDLISRCTPWPLAVCLRAANTPDDLREYANRAKANELGDVQDWHSAEVGWNNKIDVIATLTDPIDLWTLQTLSLHPPLLACGFDALRELFESNLNKIKGQDLQKIFYSIAITENQIIRKTKLEVFLLGMVMQYPEIAVRHKPIIKKLLQEYESDVAIVAHFSGLLSERDIFPAFERSYFSDNFTLAVYDYKVLERLTDFNGHPMVFRLAVRAVVRSHVTPGSIETRFLRDFQLPENATAITRADFGLLRLLVNILAVEDEGALLADIREAASENQTIWQDFISVLKLGGLPPQRHDALLANAWRNYGLNKATDAHAERLMRDRLQAHKSNLHNHSLWNRLALPLPYPIDPATSPAARQQPATPVHLLDLELKNTRILHHIKLPLFTPPADSGQWVVILGQNGTGKTTLLRSIALALRDAKNPAIWPKGTFSRPWVTKSANPDEAVGQADITIKLADGTSHHTRIRQNGAVSFNQTPEHDQSRLFPLFAYGCRRGSALGGGAREVKLGDNDGPEIATLFDDDADLIHAETWLRILENAAQKDEQSKTVFDAVIPALKTFLNLEQIESRADGIWVKETNGPQLPFQDLSDGYLTSAGWFLDMIARQVDLARRENRPIDANFMQTMHGLVLVDEIDLHLHPRWQIEIISRTRQLLPKMSFIVTTHNPLTLVGAKAQEIWVLEQENGKIVPKTHHDTPMLLTGGQIYRRYFGIADLYPNELGAALQRYSFLSNFALRNDAEQAELLALQERLAQHGILPDWEIVPRQALPASVEPVAKPKSAARAKKARIAS